MSSKKDNISLGVQQEFEDIDYWHKLSKTKKARLKDGTLSHLTEYEWAKKFMHESYANNFDRKDNKNNILKTKEQQRWARRNNNNTNRDALNVAKKAGKFATLLQICEEEALADQGGWKKLFSTNNYEAAAKKLMQDTLGELELEYDSRKIKTLLRFNYKLKTLVSYIRSDIKAQKKKCSGCRKLQWKTHYYKDSRTRDGYRADCKTCYEQRRKSE